MYLLLQRADCPALIAEPWLRLVTVPFCTIKQIHCHAIKQNRYWTEIVGSTSIIISFKCYSVLKIFKLNWTANFCIYWTKPTPTPGGVVLKFVYCVD